MTRRRRRTAGLAAASAIASVIALAGCGSVQPGVAARVGAETVTVEEVDTFARALCNVSVAGGSEAVPSRQVRVTAAQVLVGNALAEGHRAEHGGSVDQTAVEEQMRQNEQSLPEVPEEDRDVFLSTLRDYVTGQLYVMELGRRDLEAQGRRNFDQQAALERGNELLNEWAQDVEVDVDPRFGSFDGGTLAPGDGSLSVPVSQAATEAAAPTPGAGLVETLPESQQCGA